MILFNLSKTLVIDNYFYSDPFVLCTLISFETTPFWVTLGGPYEKVVNNTPSELLINGARYTQVFSYSDVKTFPSWFYDESTSTLYFHLYNDVQGDFLIQYGYVIGFSNRYVSKTKNPLLHIGNTEYLPLLKSISSVSKEEDIYGYSKLRFISGTVVLHNEDGRLDYLKDDYIVGNTAFVSYIEDVDKDDQIILSNGDYNEIKLYPYLVTEIQISSTEVSLSLSDYREIEYKIPLTRLSIVDNPNIEDIFNGKIVPLIYGRVTGIKATPLDSKESNNENNSTTYRVAEYVSEYIRVQIKSGDAWQDVQFSQITVLENGVITVQNSRDSSTSSPYELVVDIIGIPNLHATDIIKDLYLRTLNQQYNDSFYDTQKWESVEIGIPPCSIVIDSSITIYDVINKLQNGIFPSFRFDIDPNGKKYILTDDKTKEITYTASSIDILNINTLTIEEVSDYLYSEINVLYNKNYYSDSWQSYSSSAYKNAVIENYQLEKRQEIESLIYYENNAVDMAENIAREFSKTIKTISVELIGEKYLFLEIYDIIQIDTVFNRVQYIYPSDVNREFYGVLVCQVIATNPDMFSKVNYTKLKILDRTPVIPDYGFGETFHLLLEDGGRIPLEDSSQPSKYVKYYIGVE